MTTLQTKGRSSPAGQNWIPRDYLTGSLVVTWFSRSAGWFFQVVARFCGRFLLWIGVQGPVREAFPPRTVCAVLAAAIVANGLALLLLGRETTLWGAILRSVALGVALLGLSGENDWSSLWKSSLLMQWMGRRDGHR